MARKLAPCGTRSAYNRHLRYKEPACEKCRAAQAEYLRKWCKKNPEKFKAIYTRNNQKQSAKRKAAKLQEVAV